MTAEHYRVALAFALASCLVACKAKPVATTTGTPLPFPQEATIVVTNSGSDSLSVLNRRSAEVVTRSVDIDPGLHEAPHHVVYAGQSAFIAMAFPADEQASKKHGSHGRATIRGRIARLNGRTLGVDEHAEVDENPGDILRMHNQERLLVTHFDMARALRAASIGESPAAMFGTLQVWQGTPLALQQTRPLCVAPHGMALTRDDATLFVACYGSDELAIVDMKSLSVAKVTLGISPGVLGAPTYGPYSVTLSPNQQWAAVATIETGGIHWYNRETRQFTKVKLLGARAYMPAFLNETDLLVPLQAPDGFARVTISGSSSVVQSDARCLRPHAAARARSGELYVVCEGDHKGPGSVVELDAETLAIKRLWQVGIFPDGMAFLQ